MRVAVPFPFSAIVGQDTLKRAVLLDAAAGGVHRVEREGLSLSHPARFLLVGTMNPEEGDLRPQLLDRFGLAVDVTDLTDAADRAEAVRRRMAYEADPEGFAAAW